MSRFEQISALGQSIKIFVKYEYEDIFLLNDHFYVFNFTLISDIFENKAFQYLTNNLFISIENMGAW